MRKKRLLWLASWYPNREMPFYGTFVRRQALSVADTAEVIVLTIVESDAFGWQYQRQGALQEWVAYYPKNRFLKPFFFLFAGLKAYFLIKKQGFKPDLWHVHVVYPMAALAACIRLWSRPPMVVTEHWTGYKPEDGGYAQASFVLRWLTRWCIGQSSRVLSLSDYYAAAMQSHGLKGAYQSVPNVVDTSLFKPSDSEKTGKKYRLLHISGLDDRQKNITGLLEAMALLVEKRQDFRLDLIGDAQEHNRHKATVSRLGLQDYCFFQPFQDQTALAKAMQDSHLFILFSRFEGLPCVILEALCAGLPVVATETGGMSDWIHEGNGKLVASEDKAALVAAIDTALSEYDIYKPFIISKEASEKCSYAAIGQTLMSVYNSL